MRKPRIGIINLHHGIRSAKQAVVLNQMGYETHVITRAERFVDNYTTMSYYGSYDQLRATIKALDSSVDIWHVHNEPNEEMIVAREVLPKAKIIYDLHDSNYWRVGGSSWYHEDVALDCCDAVVTVSDSCKKEVRNRTEKHVVTVPSASPKSWYITRPPNFTGGLASQGGHSLQGHNPILSWRDYRKFYEQLKGKIPVHAYMAGVDIVPGSPVYMAYFDTGAKPLGKTHNELLKSLGEHDWNLVGNPSNKNKVWKYALPNKFFDALAAGLPSAVFDCPEAELLNEMYDVGINFKSVDDLIKRWDLHKEKRKNVMLRRNELSMDVLIQPLLDLYKEI